MAHSAPPTKVYVSVVTAAEALDLSTCEVMELLENGGLTGAEFEGHVLVSEKSLARRRVAVAV